MYLASFSGFLETVLIILLIFYALKFLFRWFGPSILRYILKKMGQKAMQKFGGNTNFNAKRPKKKQKTEVEIDRKPPNQHKSNKDAGEYIDYEEID